MIFNRTAVASAAVLLSFLVSVACAQPSPTPTPTLSPPAPTATLAPPTPVATSTLEPTAPTAPQAYSTNCASCHGADGKGTAAGPALPGHSAETIRRQVRNPVGIMPAFPPDRLNEADLQTIIDYIAALGPTMVGEAEWEKLAPEGVHHLMTIIALKADDIADAKHHLTHLIDALSGEHVERLREVMDLIDEGELHDAEHEMEDMLGALPIDVDMTRLHLRLTLMSIESDDAADATHHMQHFVDLATGAEQAQGEEILALLQQNKPHDAEHAIEMLLEAARP